MPGILLSYKTAPSPASPHILCFITYVRPATPQGYMEQDVYNILLRILSVQE